MYCNKCGHALPDGSRFCNYCGAAMGEAGGPQMPGAPERLERGGNQITPASLAAHREISPLTSDAIDEKAIFTLRPTLIFIAIWYMAAAFVVVVVAAIMGALHNAIPTQAAVIVILVVAAIAFSIPLYKHILRRRAVYTLTNHKLEMRYGLISKTVRNIPLRNIQDVTVTASAAQRLLRLGDIVIDSASESGKIRLHDVHHPEKYADMILGVLRQRY
jgi:membrane protein YdbS with pleckstrin-like domain